MRILKSALALMLCACILLSFASCGGKVSEKDFYAMDTFMTVTVYGRGGQNAVDKTVLAINGVDAAYSISSANGEIARLLRDGRIDSPSQGLLQMLECAKLLYERTNGAYDVSAYALYQLWRDCEKEGRVPGDSEIAAAKSLCGMDRITFDSNSVELNGVKGIDLGSIAKGYSGKAAAELLKAEDVSGALLVLGGNVVAYGCKPYGKTFRIGITDPLSTSALCGSVEVADLSVVTSGKYNRRYEVDGTVYHHIIDVKSGYPCENGVASVTVVCDDGMWADALSTALFLIGKDAALEYYKTYGGFEAVIVTDDGAITVTDGLKDSFTALR